MRFLGTKKLRTLPLAFAMFCLVSGGPYGLEPVIGKTGVTLGLLLIVLTPFLWTLPTALMTAELSTAIPSEGGYYVWVKRAMGPFAGFMCAWLSWLYSIVDAALYPLLFAEYLARNLQSFFGWELQEARVFSILVGLGHMALVTILNIRGIQAVGRAATVLTALIIIPFVLLVIKTGIHVPSLPPLKVEGNALAVGLATVLWNYLGWDNLSTVTEEIENPAKSIPRALMIAIPLVMLVYLVPTLAVLPTHMSTEHWQDGAWPEIATRAGGPIIGKLVLLAGLASATAMFVSQMLASSRIPMVLAEDGYLPRFLTHVSSRFGTPVRSILLCAGLYACLSWFSFAELITANVVLYGLSVAMEFVALAVLRIKEPQLDRPFRVPGGIPVAMLLGVFPTLLVGLVAFQTVKEEGWTKQIATGIAIALGVIVYLIQRVRAQRSRQDAILCD